MSLEKEEGKKKNFDFLVKMEKKNKKIKVAVAMSGGVDSSVAAALLKKRGFDVTGVFMHFWSEESLEHVALHLDEFINRCCSLEAERSARLAAKKIGIRFYTLNAVKEFKKAVVDYFLKELKKGVTPNPCVVCNKEIKFKVLLEKASQLGAEYVATGHYARLRREQKTKNKKQKTYHLLKAKDKNKDQSYFLYAINQKQLARYLFPVGDYLKSEVRQIAKKMKLAAWDRPESQEICFIYDNDIKRFIKKHLDLTPGKIVDARGKIIGVHEGLPLFTIGQRHGLGVGGGKPYYVAGMDYKTHKLIATSEPWGEPLWRKKLIAENVNWISGSRPLRPLKCQATIRYRHNPEKAIVKNIPRTVLGIFMGVRRKKGKGNDYEVIFSRPQRAITPGQSVVFYQGNEVLGGGVIG